MNNFIATYKNELFKISKKNKIKVAIIVSIILIAIELVISLTADNFMGINISGNNEFSIMVLPLFVSIIIPIFIIFVCSDMFCGEYSNNTLKTTLLSPASRLEIFGAKLLALLTFVGGMLAFVMIVSFIISIPINKTDFSIIKVFCSYLISIFPLSVMCLICTLVSNIVKGTGSSFMFSIIIYLAFKALEILNPYFATFFFTSGFDIYVLINAPLISFGKIIRLLLVDIGYFAMLFAAAFSLFDRKEI